MIRHAEENGHENQLWSSLNKESHAASCLHRSEAPRRALSLDGVQQLPPNCRDTTAEKVGTVVAIVGATAAGKAKPN
jgi:hypothetical protein